MPNEAKPFFELTDDELEFAILRGISEGHKCCCDLCRFVNELWGTSFVMNDLYQFLNFFVSTELTTTTWHKVKGRRGPAHLEHSLTAKGIEAFALRRSALVAKTSAYSRVLSSSPAKEA